MKNEVKVVGLGGPSDHHKINIDVQRVVKTDTQSLVKKESQGPNYKIFKSEINKQIKKYGFDEKILNHYEDSDL